MPAPASIFKALASLVAALPFFFLLSSCRTIEPAPEESGLIDQSTFALIDLDGDGKVSPVEMAKFKHREGLAEFDLDNDKEISLAEWKAAKPSAPDAAAGFHRLDRDASGKVTEDEAVLSIIEFSNYRDGFHLMDTNGDGHLHWEEYAAGDGASLDVTLFSNPLPTATP
jgi:Ca2+-binding EF-hand superfamily protein